MTNTGQLKEVSSEKYQELVRAQYAELDTTINLDLHPELKRFLLPQTIHGRALEGHGRFFDGQAKPNISMEQIFREAGVDPVEARAKRQGMMEDFLYCVDDLMDGKIDRLVDRTGKPIYGIPFLEDFKLEVDKEFFKGGVLVGRMDTPLWREKTKQHYQVNLRKAPLRLGYGEELPINAEKLQEHNIAFTSLASSPHSLEDLTVLQAKGVIVPKEDQTTAFENFFVRYSCGSGICDDAALISLGLIHGPSAMILGFAIDATDTYTKFCQNRVPGGFDEFIGAHIEKRWQEKYGESLVSDNETKTIIYLGAKDTYKMNSTFSSSHRRLIQYEESVRTDTRGNEKRIKQSKPTILNHLGFVTHGETQDFELGFERFPSLVFYENMRERFLRAGKKHYLPKRTARQ